MKGIILAGGSGSRLYPLTRITNKHLLPVYNQPMIYYPIQLLVSAGIDRILIVTGGNHAGEFLPLLGNGSAFGLKHIDYTHQERPAGIADALGLARYFAGDDSVAVILGDNIFESSIRPAVERFRQQRTGARIFLAEVEHPEQYGVPSFDDGRIVRIDEKPKQPASRYAVTGCYLYGPEVFSIVEHLKPSGRGELEITDVNNAFLERGTLEYEPVHGYWGDCGESFDSYLRVSNLVAQRGANKELPVAEAAAR
ncbi:MAG: sugar phosphate nucleotidyltransferase [Chloroflexota bacterium]|nr:sugar phosphate nucleotidyltransferase [Chloroflexota bacterium]